MSYQTIAIINFPGYGHSPWRRQGLPLPVRIGLAVVGDALVLCSVLLALTGGSRTARHTGAANHETVRERCQERAELSQSLGDQGN